MDIGLTWARSPVMLAKGPDFKKNVTIRECSILDEVPTFAAVLEWRWKVWKADVCMNC